MQALGQRANDIGQGDFTSVHQPVGGVQEIEDMRLALESMAQRVKDYQSALQDYVGAITQAQEDVALPNARPKSS